MENQDKQNQIAFYVAGSNKELLYNIDQLMSSRGILGFRDPRGRYHYLVDGRKGAPYAIRNIDDIARQLLREVERDEQTENLYATFYVDAVLNCYQFNRTLKGYHFLRSALIQIILNPSLRKPISKNLYPKVAELYQVKISQVSRNIRYCLECLQAAEQKSTKQVPLSFAEGGSLPKRTLKEIVKNYSNTECIMALERQIHLLIRRDRKRAISTDSSSQNN